MNPCFYFEKEESTELGHHGDDFLGAVPIGWVEWLDGVMIFSNRICGIGSAFHLLDPNFVEEELPGVHPDVQGVPDSFSCSDS